MKQVIYILSCALLCAFVATSCNRGPKSDIEGFQKTVSGLHYRFISQNANGRQVEKGDMLNGEMLLRLDNDTLFSNIGDPANLLVVSDGRFDGDLSEGLLMMHEGDKAVFAIDADKMAAHLQPNQMPASYKNGTNMRLYYEVNLLSVKSADEMASAKKEFEQKMQSMKDEQKQALDSYIAENNITATPNDDGLYVIVSKKGNGPKVEVGRRIKVAYTGYLLNGTIFDSSNSDIALQNNLEPHDALEFVVGQANLIKGWDDGLMGLAQGTKAKLIIPENLAYGAKGAGEMIPPYATLIFDVEILSVN